MQKSSDHLEIIIKKSNKITMDENKTSIKMAVTNKIIFARQSQISISIHDVFEDVDG